MGAPEGLDSRVEAFMGQRSYCEQLAWYTLGLRTVESQLVYPRQASQT